MATRAALVQHQARRNNMADVAAKDNSQVSTSHEESRYMLCVCVCIGDSSELGRSTCQSMADSTDSW